MYLSFYNLKVKPFQMSTDPDFLWLGEQHKEALATLKYAIIENKGVLALTGDVGTGKTTLINALIQSLGEDTLAATIYDPSLGVLEFFNVVASAFDMGETFESKGQFIIHFREFLKTARDRKQKVLLIIDEAQAVAPELLEEIRLLSNLEQEHVRLLNIFFVGQNELVDILQEYRNRALRQRITIRYHIEQLTLDETEAYIRHRLRVSGTEAPIFSPGAIDEIFAFSGGYPRLINIISDHALLSGYVQELDTVHANTIRECREELLISRKSSKYPVYGQGIPSPEAPDRELAGGIGIPEMGSEPSEDDRISFSLVLPKREPDVIKPKGDLGIPSQDWEISDDGQRLPGRDTDGVPLERDPEPVKGRRMPTFLGRDTDGVSLERDPEPVKGRRMPTFLVVVLLAAVGAIAGYVYFQDGTNRTKPRIFSITKPKEVPRSMKMAPTDDKPLILPSVPEKSEITDKVQDKTVKDSRFSTVRPPEPESSKKIAPTEGEPLDALPLPRFAGKPQPPSASEKTGAPVVSGPGSGPRETVKASIPTEGKTSGWVSPDRSKKTLVAASVPDKTSDKISTSASTPTKPPASPKISETAQQDVGKHVEKPAPKPVETQKGPSGKDLTAAKNLSLEATSSAGSSVFSKKPAIGAAAVSSVKPPAQTADVKEEPRVVHQMVTQEKERSAATLPEKKSASVQSDAPEVSLKGPAAEPETVAKQTVSQYNLQDRLKIFLRAYCRTYERKNLDMFGAFFAPDALEHGRPFKSWAPRYRQNFNRIDSMIYDIELERYATLDDNEEVRIEGTFQVSAKLSGSIQRFV
ncbi:MAG: AAA family ATPase [Deltaproteobacteria bacterium]|nr:AAA family ATPase [Deltaproteobacteria bacterium]